MAAVDQVPQHGGRAGASNHHNNARDSVGWQQHKRQPDLAAHFLYSWNPFAERRTKEATPLVPARADWRTSLRPRTLADLPPSNAVILHDDKTYYPSAQTVYGADVETMVQEEDAQPLTQPLVEPIRIRKFRAGASTGPERRWDDE